MGTLYFPYSELRWKSSAARILGTRNQSSAIDSKWGKNATFCAEFVANTTNRASPCNIWTLPWLLPLERFVSRLVAFLDDLYAGVGANRSNADHVDDDMVALNDLASAYKYFSSQVSLTFRPVLYLERKS